MKPENLQIASCVVGTVLADAVPQEMAGKGELHIPAINVNECLKPEGLNINHTFSTQDHAAAGITKDGTTTLFEVKGETLENIRSAPSSCPPSKTRLKATNS